LGRFNELHGLYLAKGVYLKDVLVVTVNQENFVGILNFAICTVGPSPQKLNVQNIFYSC